MPNTQIIPQTAEESNDTPKKFKNIDVENFEITWDGKLFGGTLGNKQFIAPGEVVTMPKYLVNYAAMHLARKMQKRKIFSEFKGTEHEKSNANIRFINPDDEIKLQKEMVALNFEDGFGETKEGIGFKSEVKEEESLKCDQCGVVAKTKQGLAAHKRSHT